MNALGQLPLKKNVSTLACINLVTVLSVQQVGCSCKAQFSQSLDITTIIQSFKNPVATNDTGLQVVVC